MFEPDWDDPDGPFGPEIRRWIAPEIEPHDEEADRDGGDFDQDEYWPQEYKRAA
jgi:hypothetical protein